MKAGRNAGVLLAAAAATLTMVGACYPPSGALLASMAQAPAPTSTALAPTPIPSATQFSAITRTPAPGFKGSGDGAVDFELLAKGRDIYEMTAGGVGCASCHGVDGGGLPGSGPFIQGAPESQVRAALGGGVPAMSFIDLSEDEIVAVVAWLQALADPNAHSAHNH